MKRSKYDVLTSLGASLVLFILGVFVAFAVAGIVHYIKG